MIKPILFNTDMVRAILNGRKTQTRRIIKPQPIRPLSYIMAGTDHGKWEQVNDTVAKHWEMGELPEISSEDAARLWTPPCHGDDILWVRETWINLPVSPGGHTRLTRGRYYYKADDPDLRPDGWKKEPWRPSIHMPKEAARIFLRVTNIRAERLQEITIDDVHAEGIDVSFSRVCGDHATTNFVDFSLERFSVLWDSTIKKDECQECGWQANPWVWAIEFERCEKPEGWNNGL